MSFQLSPISEYKTFISVDIGSYRVRATAWKIQSGELVNIAHVSLRQNRGAWLHGAIADMRSVADTISRAIAEIGEKIEYIPEDIILSFPSDAILSDIITSQYVRADRESTITMEEIDAMIQRIERQSHDKMLSKMPKYL
jgi:cell division ATPase FtsA